MSVIKYLDIEGLTAFLNQIKSKFISKENIDSALSSTSTNPVQNKAIYTALEDKVDKVSGKQLSTNDYTTTEKNKLANIESYANNYTHPTYTSRSSGLYKITVNSTGHVSGATSVQKSDITALGIPAQDTTYSNATEYTAGLMSAYDKDKLDGITSGAEPNQSAFSYVKVGTTTISADSETDTLEIVAGDNITITPNTTYDRITIEADGYTHPTSGVSAGTYKSVTVNSQGHVTYGSNPTTLAGYGITDACKLVYSTYEPSSGLMKNMIWIG